MFWLYLLGAVTVLIIALRRVLRRQRPLSEQLYWTKVDYDHMQSGVAWVRVDGTMQSANSSLAATLSADSGKLLEHDWLELFPEHERERVRECYSQMLLRGMIEFDAYGQRGDGSYAWLNVVLIAVHDSKMRFVGHHCLVLDATHTRILEDRVKQMEERVRELEAATVIG
jgi:PAS domain S-box-containing protein